MAGYCASKGGLLQLTKVMALEWARYNIQVNAILPGYIETPMNTQFFLVPASLPPDPCKEHTRVRALSLPLRRQ